MGARHADRLWMIGGAAGAVLLVVLSWFLAISPRNADTESLREQAEATQIRLSTLRHRLADLEEQATKAASFEAALKTSKAALPADSGVPDFLRQLQDSGDKVAVTVSGVTVGAPASAKAAPTVYELPITLTADGSADALGRFLDELQLTQPRAVLIQATNLTVTSEKTSLSITLKAFVAPGTGTATPATATTATTK